MKVEWSKQSKESLTDIYEYIYSKSPQNALYVLDELLKLGDSLEDEKLEYSKDLIIDDPSFRFVSKWSYKIIYKRTDHNVVILDIFNSKQNPDKLFDVL